MRRSAVVASVGGSNSVPERREERGLTAAQLGIWYAQQLDPDNPVYNVGECLEIRGRLNPEIFSAALRVVLGEADACRLRFRLAENGEPRQYVDDSPDYPVEVVDLSGEANPREIAENLMRSDLARPTPVIGAPLYTHILFRLGAESFAWYHRTHHLVFDGFSFAMFSRRVAAVYGALSGDGGTSSVPGELGPVSQLLDADQAYQASNDYVLDRQYWRESLADLAGGEPSEGGSVRIPSPPERERTLLGEDRAAGLAAAARRLRCGFAAFVIAAAAVYRHRATGERDVVLGIPMNGRTTRRTLAVPGMASNVVPLRLALRPDMPVGDLLRQVSRALVDVQRRQRYQYTDILRELNRVGGAPLYSLVVNVVVADGAAGFGDCEADNRTLSSGPADGVKLDVFRRPDGSGLRLDVLVDPGLPEAVSGAEVARRFTEVLRCMAEADASDPVGGIELLTEAERRVLLREWNEADGPMPTPEVEAATIAAAFTAQAGRTPDGVAVVSGDVELSYAQVDERAEAWARRLCARGVGPESLVGVMLPRGVDLVVALLAVLKAGAAYLPIDPEYPADRVAYMVADSRAALVITDPSLQGRLSGLPGDVPVLTSLEDPAAEGVHADEAVPVGAALPDSPAYVIYTSGSTGRPKGVVVPHRAVMRMFAAARARFGFGADEVWSWFHSAAFDFSVWELFGALLHGGRVVVVPFEVSRSPEAMWELVRQSGVTVLSQTPSAFYQLAEAEPRSGGAASSLRWVVFGGEALEPGASPDGARVTPNTHRSWSTCTASPRRPCT